MPQRPERPAGMGNKCFNYFLGESGMGKTVGSKVLLREYQRAGWRGIIMDPNGAFDTWAPGQSPAPWAYGMAVSITQAVRIVRQSNGRVFWLVVRRHRGEEWQPLYDAILSAGNMVLTVDEAQKWAAPNRSADLGFIDLNERCRLRQVDWITTSQAPATLHPAIRNNWDRVVCFRQGVPLYAENMERDFLSRIPGAAHKLLNLEKGHYIAATKDGRPPVFGVLDPDRDLRDHNWGV